MKRKVLVFIPNRTEKMHQVWMLKQCLESLFDTEPSLSGHVIVCDDLSPLEDQFNSTVDKYRLKVMRHKARANYSKMINSGIKCARVMGYDYLLTVNNDIVHKTQFLGEFLSLFESDENLQVAGPLLFYPDGRTQHGGVEVIDQKNWCRDHSRGEFMDFSSTRYCHHVTGAWQWIRVAGLSRLYDERFNFGFEDVDFTMKLWEEGKRSLFTNKVHHIHYESTTRGSILGPRELDNALLFRETPYNFEIINEHINKANATTLHLLG